MRTPITSRARASSRSTRARGPPPRKAAASRRRRSSSRMATRSRSAANGSRRCIRPATPRGACATCGAITCSRATRCSSTVAAARTSNPAAPRRCTAASRKILFALPGRHHRLAGARLPGPHAHDHRRREGGQSEDRRQDRGRIRRHHGRARSAEAEAHRRSGACQPHVGPAARRGRRPAARRASRGGLRRRRFAAARLQVVAIGRSRAGRRAYRRRARVGGIHSRRRAARVEAVAGHGDERRVRCRASRAAVPKGKKVVLLCRSGVRSIAAAKRATELGIEAYNILEGFEGDPDERAQRGHKGGWRRHGLPWRQG